MRRRPRHSGVRLSGVVAPMLFGGAMDSATYTAWVGRCLVPKLRCGGVVVVDNLSSYKSVEAVGVLASAGCRVLFLPPYSVGLKSDCL